MKKAVVILLGEIIISINKIVDSNRLDYTTAPKLLNFP